MEGFKYFVRDGVMHLLIRCDLMSDVRQGAKVIRSLIQTLRNKINKVIVYKLGISDNIDMVYASLLQGEVPSGIIIQTWDNPEELVKLLDGIATNNLSEEYLCG